MKPASARFALVDVLKGLACALIVWHHLSSYGPMVDVAQPLAPGLTAFLYDHGRLAVQVFLVLAGFMAAHSLAPLGVARFDKLHTLIGRRYARLALPYFVALTAAIWAASLARSVAHPDSVPAAASVADVVIHILMLQDWLGVDALSAGVWYLAIDLQLFALAALLLAGVRWCAARYPLLSAQALGLAVVMLATAGSLWWFNRRPGLDYMGVYFFGSYGLGMLAYWAVQAGSATRRHGLLAAMALMGAVGLLLEFRERIALALGLALLLVLVSRSQRVAAWASSPGLGSLSHLGRISYSVFLIHYPVCLVFNAFMGQWWPSEAWANALGMLLAFGASVALADLMYRHVENLPLSHLRLVLWSAPLFMMTAIAHH